MTLSVKFWGVRGSCASPGAEFLRYGGNTPCIEVRAGATTLVLDAGTGLRKLGQHLLSKGKVDVTLLLSHVHWDHIQGLPFFAPLYVPGTRVHVVGGANPMPLRDCLHRQMSAPNFPVDLRDVAATLTYFELRDRQKAVLGDAEVTAVRANHPDGVYAYRIEHKGRVVVYATDTEHYACVDKRLLALCKDADVLIYDTQYLPEEYSGERGMSRVGWGHSTYEAAAILAQAANVKDLVLFHHDPDRTDDQVAAIEARAKTVFARSVAAHEGMEIELAPARIHESTSTHAA
ncbi:MAG: MBL fold metallo-hydrolase [Deltaproteobacteria bacterium]|nr:MBL fold metallo-hydrolase [Deltaproteobacteria bacterium]